MEYFQSIQVDQDTQVNNIQGKYDSYCSIIFNWTAAEILSIG